MKNPFKSASHIEQEPKQNLSDLQFVASLQHQIDELQSLINNDVLNVLRQDCYREHIEVNTISNHEIVASFIKFIHLKHPSIIGEFYRVSEALTFNQWSYIFSMTHFMINKIRILYNNKDIFFRGLVYKYVDNRF